MSSLTTAKEILDTMLGYLGFVVQIEEDHSRAEPSLQVITEEHEHLIGPDGERLDDIQYLVNRLLQIRDPKASRVRIDVQHFRNIQEDQLIEEAERLADRVVNSGHSAKMEPLNSYFRRIVHNHFLNHPKIQTWSPPDSARLKRITLRLKSGGEQAES